MSVRILLLEDQAATRERLARMIRAQGDFELLGAVATIAEATKLLAEKPDVLLADLGLPDGNGVDLIRAACKALPELQVMVLTVFADEERVVSALEAGARSYLLKDDAFTDVVGALREMLGGGSPLSPGVARCLLKRLNLTKLETTKVPTAPAKPATEAPAALPDKNKLTDREAQVLSLVARGYSHADVATALQLSVYTIGCHVQHIYRKLAVNSRAEAVFEAIELGLVDVRR